MGEINMLNFVLCDDNLNIVAKMHEMLELLFVKHDIEAKIAFTSDNAIDVLNFVNNNHVDVMILDINLNSDISGIDLAKKVRKNSKT